MTQAYGLILGAILVATLQAQARHAMPLAAESVVPVHWLSENFNGSLCTGIDLNGGSVPIELTTGGGEVSSLDAGRGLPRSFSEASD